MAYFWSLLIDQTGAVCTVSVCGADCVVLFTVLGFQTRYFIWGTFFFFPASEVVAVSFFIGGSHSCSSECTAKERADEREEKARMELDDFQSRHPILILSSSQNEYFKYIRLCSTSVLES